MERSVWGTVTGFEEMVCPFCGYRFRAGKQPQQSQCIMKTRPASEGRSWMWRRLRSATAAREELQWCMRWERGQEVIGKGRLDSAGEECGSSEPFNPPSHTGGQEHSRHCCAKRLKTYPALGALCCI